MGFIQIAVSLWPFLKEMLFGEKIKDPSRSKDDVAAAAQKNNKDWQINARIARWGIDKMQQSRRFLAFVLLLLFLSLFVNYKTIDKLSAMIPVARGGDKLKYETATTEGSEMTIEPPFAKTERDDLLEQTVMELKSIYGDSK